MEGVCSYHIRLYFLFAKPFLFSIFHYFRMTYIIIAKLVIFVKYCTIMKIKSIEIKNSPILGNLFLNFTDNDGKPIDNIIFAGENGTGKTTILNYISSLGNQEFSPISTGEAIVFNFFLTDEECLFYKNYRELNHYFGSGISNNELQMIIDFTQNRNVHDIKFSFLSNEGKRPSIPFYEINRIDFFRKQTSIIYSQSEINFNPTTIYNVTAKEIDRKDQYLLKSNENLATEVAQLLVDIQTVDDHEFAYWARKTTNSTLDKSKLDKRMNRFKNAFNFMFNDLKYKNIINIADHKQILFERNNKEIPISKLSSGEKQIVFRGSFLLKDINSLNGALVLIDEPEISMHPLWQLKIVEFYKNIFTNNIGDQTSQIFFATHSPFIVDNINPLNKKIIILKKSETGEIYTPQSSEYFGWTSEKIIEETFKIKYNLDKSLPYVFIAGETDEIYIKRAINLFSDLNDKINVSWIGRVKDDGNVEFTGDTNLNNTISFMKSKPHLVNKALFIFDWDRRRNDENYKNIFVRSLKFNEQSIKYKKGIENLLSLPENFEYVNFISETDKTDDYGVQWTKKSLDKRKLCNYICDELTPKQQKEVFKNFKQIIDIIKTTILA